jgi:dTMP kinase
MSRRKSAHGRFITLEGTEGVGKTTNLELVSGLVQLAGYRVVVTREPGGTPLAEDVRNLLLEVREETMHAMTELLLVFAARAQHLEQVIEPALAGGAWVVCDRFTDATYAYQGGGRGMDLTVIEMLENLVQGSFRPDLTLYLDVSADVAKRRIADRDHDRFEREQDPFFARVRDAYLARARDSCQIRVVDAGRDLADVQSEITRAVEEYITGAEA